jgi:polygalacturonase
MPVAPAPAPADDDSNVYDLIKDFGAAGDGVADDTDAVKTAWDTACQADEESVIVAAAGHSFLVHTTTFTGPCQGTVTLQVIAKQHVYRKFVGSNWAGSLLILKSEF